MYHFRHHNQNELFFSVILMNKIPGFKPAMSNPNGLLSQELCHYLNQGRTLNDVLVRVAH